MGGSTEVPKGPVAQTAASGQGWRDRGLTGTCGSADRKSRVKDVKPPGQAATPEPGYGGRGVADSRLRQGVLHKGEAQRAGLGVAAADASEEPCPSHGGCSGRCWMTPAGTALGVQGWRPLPVQGTQVQPPTREEPTSCKAAKAVSHTYWAHILEPGSCKKPPQWAHTPARRATPARLTLKKPMRSREDRPSQRWEREEGRHGEPEESWHKGPEWKAGAGGSRGEALGMRGAGTAGEEPALGWGLSRSGLIRRGGAARPQTGQGGRRANGRKHGEVNIDQARLSRVWSTIQQVPSTTGNGTDPCTYPSRSGRLWC